MKKLFVVLMAVLGLVSSTQAQQTYGPRGGSVQGREYWFNQEGGQDSFNKDLQETIKRYDRFPSCDMQRILMNGRWQVCRQCGVVNKQSAPNLAFSYPVQCM